MDLNPWAVIYFLFSNLTIFSTELDFLSITKAVDMGSVLVALILHDSDQQLEGEIKKLGTANTRFQVLCSNLFSNFRPT